METRYLGLISFSNALAEEDAAFRSVSENGEPLVLGFEAKPVITLGVRGTAEADLTVPEIELSRRGFELFRVPRGGQATLHNPGQLVIFPVFKIGRVRPWIELLAEVTRDTLSDFGVDCRWDACKPGLYTGRGKITAFGLKIREGISTHGLAINVHNRLEDFQLIRACGESDVQVDRFQRPIDLPAVFSIWCEHLRKRQ